MGGINNDQRTLLVKHKNIQVVNINISSTEYIKNINQQEIVSTLLSNNFKINELFLYYIIL